jgi:hypothetical protein
LVSAWLAGWSSLLQDLFLPHKCPFPTIPGICLLFYFPPIAVSNTLYLSGPSQQID